jgi:hypothetical protein
VKGRLWKWASSIGAPWGNLEGEVVYRGLWETVKERSVSQASLSMGAELRGRAPSTGILKASLDMSRRPWIWRISLLIVA